MGTRIIDVKDMESGKRLIAVEPCDLHLEFNDGSKYICDPPISMANELLWSDIPENASLHLSAAPNLWISEMERRLRAIALDRVELRRNVVTYYINDCNSHEWKDFLWQSFSLAGEHSFSTRYQWERRFEFVLLPTLEEYKRELTVAAKEAGFSVREGIEVFEGATLTKSLAPTEDELILALITKEILPLDSRMLTFLANETVLYDRVRDEKLVLGDETKENF